MYFLLDVESDKSLGPMKAPFPSPDSGKH